MKGHPDPSEANEVQPVAHYYTYTRNLRTGEWFGFFNSIVAKVENAQIMQLFAENALAFVLVKIE